MPSSPHVHARPLPLPELRASPLFSLLVVLLVTLAPSTRPLHAQEAAAPPADSATALAARTVTLVGVVRDTGGRPLSGAEVRASATQLAFSDSEGRFELTGVEPDTVQLLVRRIGYQPANVLLTANPGLRVELAVTLVPSAVELGTIVVAGRRLSTHLLKNGFYDRQKRSLGTLLGPEELERSGASLSGLMHMMPGVSVKYGRNNVPVAYGRSGTSLCPLNVFIDGLQIPFAGDHGLDQLLSRNDILAVEVYARAGLIPSTLSGRSSASRLYGGSLPSPETEAVMDKTSECGAILIWTRPFNEEQEKRAGRPGR